MMIDVIHDMPEAVQKQLIAIKPYNYTRENTNIAIVLHFDGTLYMVQHYNTQTKNFFDDEIFSSLKQGMLYFESVGFKS